MFDATGQSGCALPVKYRPLLRVSRRKACPFLEVQLPRFQQGGAAESDPKPSAPGSWQRIGGASPPGEGLANRPDPE